MNDVKPGDTRELLDGSTSLLVTEIVNNFVCYEYTQDGSTFKGMCDIRSFMLVTRDKRHLNVVR